MGSDSRRNRKRSKKGKTLFPIAEFTKQRAVLRNEYISKSKEICALKKRVDYKTRLVLNMGHMVALGIIFTSVLCLANAYDPSECDVSESYFIIFKIEKHNCDCKSSRAGQLKFDSEKVFVCTGREWKALQYEVSYGGKSNPGSSCEDINNAGQIANGIYWIKRNDRRNAFPVYCDMAAGGWTMVFKAVSGVHKSAYDTYNNGQTSSEEVMAALDTTDHHMDHYKNRIVLNWKDFHASEARVVLYKGGKRLMELKFNAHGSDKLNWFSFSRLTQSPWSDINTQPKNYFSIRGEPAHKRYFFINRSYGGCPGDTGWMMVAGPLCSWEKHYLPRKNVILYSKLPGYTNWNHYQNVGVADVLVVYVR